MLDAQQRIGALLAAAGRKRSEAQLRATAHKLSSALVRAAAAPRVTDRTS